MRFRQALSLGICLLLFLAADDAQSAEGWRKVAIPQTWKRPPGEIEGQGKGYAWYRCQVAAPAEWKGRELRMIGESADDARQYYLNGKLLGQAGNFPPTYRSGLGETTRLKIPADYLRPGQNNVFAIRVYQRASRTNFHVAPPVLLRGEVGIRMLGEWEFRPGDLAEAEVAKTDSTLQPFAKIESASELEKTFRKISDEEGALAPQVALSRFEVPDDLALDLVLSEPHIGQPLSIKWDHRGRLWVMQYLQYPTPAGLKMVSRDKYLRSVYDKTPPPPPNHFRGADKISIHEDTDGDGQLDQHTTFLEGLSLASSFAIGRGGVFVLNPPYLLFYPDKNGDDRPDGDPEVLLQGFGIEDSHSIANSLRWGPDGWLYAAQGSTVTGAVRRPSQKPEEATHSLGQLIWRYHPERRIYEVYAEGGGNAFGVEIDRKGRIYSGHNGGDTRGFHYVQGGYYRKGFGKHGPLSNPHAFGYFSHMAHHRVTRFTHQFVIYEGGSLPGKYEGVLFGVAPLLSHVVMSSVSPDRSSFRTKDIGHAMATKDPWFRPVDVQVGPDGGVYVADFYEQRIDHSSHYQGRVDRGSGRIYRIRAKDAPKIERFDLSRLTTEELIARLDDPNKWLRQSVLRLLGDRKDASAIAALRERLDRVQGQAALETFWALHLCGGFNDDVADASLEHADPFVRAWTVRLLGDNRSVSNPLAKHLAELAYREPHVQVRSQMACSARRLPPQHGLPILANLAQRSEDVGDIHIPLLLWWALETHVNSDADAVMGLFAEESMWKLPMTRQHLVQPLMRRLCATGTRRDLLAAAKLFNQASTKDDAKMLVAGFEQAYAGRSLAGLPTELSEALSRAGGGSLALQIRQGDEGAWKQALAIIQDAKRPDGERVALVEIIGQTLRPEGVSPLLAMLEQRNESLRQAALFALQSYRDDQIGERVLQLLPQLPKDTQEAAFGLLTSRPQWTLQLLSHVDEGELKKSLIPMAAVRRAMLHSEDQIRGLIDKHWGQVQGATTAEMKASIQRYTEVIGLGSGNPYNGKVLFKGSCGKCHVLFREGGKIGPDLTSFKRDDLNRMLVNVVNPSIEIREGYESHALITADGRALSGFIEEQDDNVVVLKSADGQRTILPRDDIDDMKALPTSIMPEGILKGFSDQEVRDLFAYLRATQPLP